MSLVSALLWVGAAVCAVGLFAAGWWAHRLLCRITKDKP